MKNLKPIIVTAFAMLGATAGAKGTFELKNSAFTEREIVAKDGSKTKELVPLVKALPGEEVVYVITYKNIGEKPAADVIINNVIPRHMAYERAEGKVKSGMEFSVDGGKSYGPLAKLKVNESQKKRPARPEDVTHVQWKLAAFVQPKQEGEIKFRAVLR